MERRESDFVINAAGPKQSVNVPPPPFPVPPFLTPEVFPQQVLLHAIPPQPALINGECLQGNSPFTAGSSEEQTIYRATPGSSHGQTIISGATPEPMRHSYLQGNSGNCSINVEPAGNGVLIDNKRASFKIRNNSYTSNRVPQVMRMKHPYKRGNIKNSGISNHLNAPNSCGVHCPCCPMRYKNSVGCLQSFDASQRKAIQKGVPQKRDPHCKREDAILALNEESKHSEDFDKPSLTIKFPDLYINEDIVKSYHHKIVNVHFPANVLPRRCNVRLKEGSNVERTIENLKRIQIDGNFLQVERRRPIVKRKEDNDPKFVNPNTLYVGNLSPNVNVKSVKEKFPNAKKYDIGYADRMKNTRYAFVRYDNVHDAVKAYNDSYNGIIDSRSIVVRFKRRRASDGTHHDETEPQMKQVLKTEKGEEYNIENKDEEDQKVDDDDVKV